MSQPMPVPRTQSWTPAQREFVSEWLLSITDELSKRITEKARRLTRYDKRPKQVWSKEQPDVFFPYAAQALLEDLIAELQERV